MDYQNLRISKLRDYLINIITTLTNSDNFQINADMLSNVVDNYSLDKLPTESTIETWVTGDEIHRDVYSFRSRMEYSQDVINNLTNIGFFEQFENIIKFNNKNGILPEIKGIQEISCLNCGTMNYADTKTAEFNIQVQATYIVKNEEEVVSL